MNSIGLSAATVAGCAAGLWLLSLYPAGLDSAFGWVLMLLAFACLLPVALAPRTNKRLIWSGLLLMGALAGCGRSLLTHSPAGNGDLANYNRPNRIVTVTGHITGEPALSDRAQTARVASEAIALGAGTVPLPVQGDMVAVLARLPEYGVGERLTLTGRLIEPPQLSEFDYATYLARQSVYSYMSFPTVRSVGRTGSTGLGEIIASARQGARDALRRNIAEPEAALATGIIVGDRSSMPDDLTEAFRRSGTTHILAISGQNITLLVGIVWLMFGGRSKRLPAWGFVLMLVLLAGYTAFTGAQASVVRAALMGSVLLAAPLVGRRYDATAALSVSALTMVLADPRALADAGFQLSFAAMLGIVFVGPLLLKPLSGRPVWRAAAAPVAVGLAAQAGTLPLLANLSGQVSLVSIAASLVAEVLMVPLMVGGIVTVIAGAVPLLPAISGAMAWLSGWAMVANVRFWAGLPWAAITVDRPGIVWIALYASALCLLLWLVNKRRGVRATAPAKRPVLALNVTLGIAAAAIWLAALWAALN